MTKPRSREAGSVSSAHADSGLWPLLLGSAPYNACPWTTGEFFPAMMSSPDDHDPAAYLADQWRDYADVSVTAPFGARWPGLAEPPATVGTPDEAAGDLAEHLLADSAVLHDWEDRFGARVVGLVGAAILKISTANPSTEIEQAVRIAAEHFAFCPDNVWQGSGTLEAYAKQLIGMQAWTFWWD